MTCQEDSCPKKDQTSFRLSI